MSTFQIIVIVLLLMATGLYQVVQDIMFGALMLVVLIGALIWGGFWLTSSIPHQPPDHIPYHDYTGSSAPVSPALTQKADGSDADHPIVVHNMDEYSRYPNGTYVKDPAAGITVLKGSMGIVRRDR